MRGCLSVDASSTHEGPAVLKEDLDTLLDNNDKQQLTTILPFKNGIVDLRLAVTSADTAPHVPPCS